MKTTVEEYYARMEDAVAALLESDKVKDYFARMAKLTRYSFANILLILFQRPGATKVARMSTWNAVGRKVKKGEKGIAIFAPLFRKERSSEDGHTESRLVGFRPVYVFDISQTEGKDLACKELQGTTDFVVSPGLAIDDITSRLRAVCPVPVIRKPLAHMRGYYDPANRVIVLSEDLTDSEVPRTLIHEMAHWFASSTGEHRVDGERDRPMEEVVAEAAAFIALSRFGLDTGSISFGYIAGWGRDLKKIVSWGSAAMRVARGLIDLIEGDEEQKAA